MVVHGSSGLSSPRSDSEQHTTKTEELKQKSSKIDLLCPGDPTNTTAEGSTDSIEKRRKNREENNI